MTGNLTDSEPTARDTADDPVATIILGALAALDRGGSLSVMDAARAVAEDRRRPSDGPELWRRYMTAVRQQATHLARQGRIEIVRKGKPVDPNNFKGVVRLRLPLPDPRTG